MWWFVGIVVLVVLVLFWPVRVTELDVLLELQRKQEKRRRRDKK